MSKVTLAIVGIVIAIVAIVIGYITGDIRAGLATAVVSAGTISISNRMRSVVDRIQEYNSGVQRGIANIESSNRIVDESINDIGATAGRLANLDERGRSLDQRAADLQQRIAAARGIVDDAADDTDD